MRLFRSEVCVVCNYLFVIIRALFPKLDKGQPASHIRDDTPEGEREREHLRFFNSQTSDRPLV